MHLLVTDRATCAHCGPEFGLILLAERVQERRVLEGELGCPNCRERYPIRGGFADLRPPPRHAPEASEPPGGDDAEGALRVGALLGLEPGPGFVLLAGDPVRQAGRLAAMLEGLEIVTLHPGLRGVPEESGVSRLQVGARIPFFPQTFRGVVLEGEWVQTHLEEAIRVLRSGGRLLLLGPGEGDPDRLEAGGLELLLVTGKAVVGAR